jgi:hypothetical protein
MLQTAQIGLCRAYPERYGLDLHLVATYVGRSNSASDFEQKPLRVDVQRIHPHGASRGSNIMSRAVGLWVSIVGTCPGMI